jgi:hypothetical protein
MRTVLQQLFGVVTAAQLINVELADPVIPNSREASVTS